MTTPLTAPQFPEWPQYDDAERTALVRALEQGQWWRMGGGEVDAFEREFAAFHGGGHALAVTNGTHALELALQVLGVGPGDEVIVPAFTFISSSQAAQRLGATAVPVDVDLGTYNLDPAAAEAAITPRTKAIMPVHMAGQIADLDALGKISERTGVPLLQDAAHAHGAEWRGRKVGELGSVAAFSFQNGKLMTAGEGGLVLFADEEGRDHGFLRHSCGRPPTDIRYLHATSGSNFRLNEFSASVLRAQLARLGSQVETRERRAALLAPLLAAVPGVVPQSRDERATRVPHYMAMFRVPGIGEERRNALVAELVRRGLPAFVVFRAVYRTNGFWETGAPALSVDELAERNPNTELIHSEGIWLHHRTLLADEDAVRAIPGIIAAALESV
ncbi:DegT/DnrJ/EryC1/StrS family aminotransferase [Actinomadura flavalba]|uniref:DegT/DnrJ/EryC1/StrS family aminotransferase n=1 Tax=Actinomadura flavalba TaxID=1120938 RepID=UPI00039F6C65|nr:DegT/DnrJ/EryC1/StrS family aminotransferase [Actinomadura flavalba]